MQLPERLRHLAKSTGAKAKAQSLYVYVVQCNEFVKVGIASDVAGRIADMQVGNPYLLNLLGFWRATDAIREEEIIHIHLSEYRERGEWFRLPKSMMDNVAMKMPGYEMAQRIMPRDEFSSLRAELWRLNASDYHKHA